MNCFAMAIREISRMNVVLRQKMVENPALVAMKNADHVEQFVSVQLGWQEMGPPVDLTVI